jgi:hypothetical protein
MNNNLSLGHDGEFLVRNVRGKIVCPKKWITSLKKEVPAQCNRGGFNRDGMAVELNPKPAHTPEEMIENTRLLFDEVTKQLMKFGYKITEQVGADIFKEGDQRTFAEDVLMGGCAPDFNAYTGKTNCRGIDYKIYPYRFCGGHIHIEAEFIRSWTQALKFIRDLDKNMFKIVSKFETQEWSKKRREAYGQKGDFRWKPQNNLIEYRTPDASWVWADLKGQKASHLLFDVVDQTITKFRKSL